MMKKTVLTLMIMIATVLIYGQKAYVVNSGSSTLSEVNLADNSINNSFAFLGNMANRLALTEEKAYVVNTGDNNIQIINLSDGSTAGNIYLGTSVNPYDIIIENGFAYVTGGLNNKVYKLNLGTETIEESIEVGGNPAGLTILDNKLYIGNTDYVNGYLNSSVSVIDLENFAVINTIPTSANPQYLLAINNKLHVVCGGNWVDVSGVIQIFDTLNNEILHTIDLGGSPGSVVYYNGNIYVGESMGSAVYAYDEETYQLIYSPASPFIPGGSSLCTDGTLLGIMGGQWGENFSLTFYDNEENQIHQFTTALYATDIKFAVSETSAEEDDVLESVAKLSNYPNPFNPKTTIHFSSKAVNEIDDEPIVKIFNSKGQVICSLTLQRKSEEEYSAVWNGKDDFNRPVSNGIYFYRIDNRMDRLEGRMLLLK